MELDTVSDLVLIIFIVLLLFFGNQMIVSFFPKLSAASVPEPSEINLITIQKNTLVGIIDPVYINPLKVESIVYATILSYDDDYGGQCVAFIQKFLELDFYKTQFKGYAGYIEPNSTQPQIGSAVLFDNHVALIIDIIEDELMLIESNYNFQEKIKTGRMVNIDSGSIRGYFVFQFYK